MKSFQKDIMKKFIFLIVFFLISLNSFAQNYNNVKLVFNNKQANGNICYLQDILDTDTLKTNYKDLTITGFVCSSICSIDWELKHNSNILSTTAKKYIKNCVKNNSRLYFDNIKAVTKEGRTISLNSIALRIRITEK